MPRIARLSIAPVMSLGLEHPDEIDLTEVGVVEDRRFFLVDDADRLIDRLVVGELVQIGAHTDPAATLLRLTFPDGWVLEDEVRLAEPHLLEHRDRPVEGHVVDGPWSEPLSDFAGRRLRLIRCDRPGGTRRGNAVSMVGDGSLAELATHAGVEAVDARRFRMLIDLEGAAAREEDGWIGRRVALGGSVLAITKPDARCAITTQDPDTGRRDLDVLRTIIAYRGVRDGKKVDFGVLGEVARPGRIRVGDEVSVVD